jgi:hypothetical protein
MFTSDFGVRTTLWCKLTELPLYLSNELFETNTADNLVLSLRFDPDTFAHLYRKVLPTILHSQGIFTLQLDVLNESGNEAPLGTNIVSQFFVLSQVYYSCGLLAKF